MLGIDDYAAGFDEEPGYLDFASAGPVGRAVADEQRALTEVLATGRFGGLDVLYRQDERVREAIAGLTGRRADQVVFQPNTSTALLHAVFGLSGRVLLSPAEYPSLPFAAVRAAAATGAVEPVWLEPDYGRVTPGGLRERLDDDCTAVAVSLVDFRTGYLADLDGIRQVIGDRMLIVDAVQGFGVVDAPWEAADVIAAGGQKWMRAGWGTGFLALSDRAVDRLAPVLSGESGADLAGTGLELPVDAVLDPVRGAAAFSVTNPDPIAEARLAVAAERIAEAGVGAVAAALADRVSRIIDLADEFAVPVASPRAETERAGIVVLRPAPDRLTSLSAALHNHGISATVRGGGVRLSPHVSTGEETLGMLRAALVSHTAGAVV